LNKTLLYKYMLSLFFTVCIIGILGLYIYYAAEVLESLRIEGAVIIVFITLIRAFILLIIAFYIFNQWFKQEQQYLSDIPFLFGFFFLVYSFGKALDLLTYLVYFKIGKDEWLILIKIRYFVVITTFLPMIYLSMAMFLFYLSLKEKFLIFKISKLKEKENIRKRKWNITSIIFTIEFILIFISPNTLILSLLLPVFFGFALFIIIWMLYFANKNKALSQINSKILLHGFLTLLISQIAYAFGRAIIGEWAIETSAVLFVIIVESMGLIANVIIFLGFYLKPKYYKVSNN